MKTLLALAAATFALTTVAQPQAQAGHPQASSCRVHSHCGQCRQPVYSYYRPVRYVNRVAVYAWVPSQHNQCRSGVTTSRYHRGPSVSIHSHNYGYSRLRSYHTTPSLRSTQSFYRHSPSIRFRSYRSCR